MSDYTVGSPCLIPPLSYEPDGLEGQQALIQSINRDFARAEVRAWVDRQRAEFEAKMAEIEKRIAAGCDFCRGLPIGGGYDLKFDCDRIYGLRIEDEDWVMCPQCNRCVASWGG